MDVDLTQVEQQFEGKILNTSGAVEMWRGLLRKPTVL
jgi:hypothetical protein